MDFCFVSCCRCSGVCLVVIVCYGEVPGLAFSLCLCRCFLVGFSCTLTFPGAAWFDRMSVHSEAPRESKVMVTKLSLANVGLLLLIFSLWILFSSSFFFWGGGGQQ